MKIKISELVQEQEEEEKALALAQTWPLGAAGLREVSNEGATARDVNPFFCFANAKQIITRSHLLRLRRLTPSERIQILWLSAMWLSAMYPAPTSPMN